MSRTAQDVTDGIDLSGKVAVVTGVNSGIGLETARVLALRGARVFGLARTLESATAACASLSGQAEPVGCELTDPDSIRRCATTILEKQTNGIHLLILNAGIMALPKLEQVRGIEKQFATNHLGHFLLTHLLQPALGHQQPVRVVVVSSAAHFQAPRSGIDFDNLSGAKGYSSFQAYGQSKLANVLFANELARRLPAGSTANSLHPGVIKTNLGRSMQGPLPLLMGLFFLPFMKTPEEGAATTCYVATSPSLDGVTGRYFADCRESRPSAIASDQTLAKRLWTTSETLLDLKSG